MLSDSESSEDDSKYKNLVRKELGITYSSSSDSDDSDLGPLNEFSRVENYSKNVVANMDDQQFENSFRVTPFTFNKILELVTPSYEESREFHTGGVEAVPTQDCLDILLYYLANMASFRVVGELFGHSESTIFNIVNKMCDCLIAISPKIIRWPSEQEAVDNGETFYKLGKIRNVIGCLDGSHIKIKKLMNDDDFINRNNYASILLQGVCDSNKKFIDVYCGEPGSVHDSRMLRRSPLSQELSESEVNLYNYFFILGDSAYASTSWVVPPFKKNRKLSAAEKKFNYHHSQTRIYIENAFGLLKGRFRRLQNFENNNIEFIVRAIVGACTLHNLCQDYDDMHIEEYQDPVNRVSTSDDGSSNESTAKRNMVFQQWRLDMNI